MKNSQSSVSLIPTPDKPIPFEISARSLAKRSRFVFAFVVGFYLYAILISAVLVAGGYLLISSVIAIIGPKWSGAVICAFFPVPIFCFGTALIILWSLIPRRRRFVAPGPSLDLSTQPRLQELVRSVANSTGQPMPGQVYLDLEVNAGVTERGGIVGFGKRRVLILGLPLFTLLTVPQFQALLAHEFGHYYWGDTRLGPWLHRAHHAMRNTIETLHEAKYTAWVNLLFFWYAEELVDKTERPMKNQEYLADHLSARVAGRESAILALQTIHIGDDTFYAYWNGTLQPLLAFGVRPPLLEGYRRFLAVQRMTDSVQRQIDTRMKEDKTESRDTHPALLDRVAALALLPSDMVSEQVPNLLPAVTLLDDVSQLELGVLSKKSKRIDIPKLKPVDWDNISLGAYLPMWKAAVKTYAPGLKGVTPDELPDMVKNLSLFGMEMLKKSNKSDEIELLAKRTSMAIGSALSVALYRVGWKLNASPGEAVLAQRNGRRIEPFEILGRLVSRRLSGEDWRAECADAGIVGVDLGRLD